MLHNYPESKAFFPTWERWTAIKAEKLEFLHDRRFFGLHGVEQRLRRNPFIDEERDIAHHRWEARRLFRLRQRHRLERLAFELEEHRRPRQLVLALPLGMQLADPS